MARRSPFNERYGKNAKIGSTRRSASSAKPKREAGKTASTTSKPAAKKEHLGYRDVMPTSPEIKRWRMWWWVLFGIMLADAAFTQLVPAMRTNVAVQNLGFVVLVAAFAGSMYIELIKIRRLRKQLIDEMKQAKKGSTKS